MVKQASVYSISIVWYRTAWEVRRVDLLWLFSAENSHRGAPATIIETCGDFYANSTRGRPKSLDFFHGGSQIGPYRSTNEHQSRRNVNQWWWWVALNVHYSSWIADQWCAATQRRQDPMCSAWWCPNEATAPYVLYQELGRNEWINESIESRERIPFNMCDIVIRSNPHQWITISHWLNVHMFLDCDSNGLTEWLPDSWCVCVN